MMKSPRYKTYLFILSVTLNILAVTFFVGKRIYYYRSGLPENRTHYRRHSSYRQRVFNLERADIKIPLNELIKY
jgi:hypothetical protein